MSVSVRMLRRVLRRKGVSDAVVLKRLHRATFPVLVDLHEAVQHRVALNKQRNLDTTAPNFSFERMFKQTLAERQPAVIDQGQHVIYA